MINKMYEKHFLRLPLLFWIILIVGFLTRVCFLESLPMGVNQDEAMGAMDAWALSKYGTDRYGMQWPVHFTAWISGQMSVCLSYLMIPFIKALGFTTYAVRLPLALVGVITIAVIFFIAKYFMPEKWALAVMALTVVCPWHFMQGRWALDCHMFPHVFLMGFLFLLKGFERKRYLYMSMIFFGLTFYCYGVAMYTVPIFLLVYAVWCLIAKQFNVKDVLVSIAIFLIVAAPELITIAINMFGLEQINTPLFTLPKFPGGVRSKDIIFAPSYNTKKQLVDNIVCFLKYGLFQQSDVIFNVLPGFGPLYYISTPFYFVGAGALVKKVWSARGEEQAKCMALIGFLMCGVWVGIVTNNVNVSRINIIFYPLIILTIYGICVCAERIRKWRNWAVGCVTVLYGVCAVAFVCEYCTTYATVIKDYFCVDFLDIVKQADMMEEYETLWITDRAGVQQLGPMSEVLTQYALQIDAKYYQEETNITGGRELLPYSERYHWKNVKLMDWEANDILYVLHKKDLDEVSVDYEILRENESYIIAVQK